jgi:hypothetical protein
VHLVSFTNGANLSEPSDLDTQLQQKLAAVLAAPVQSAQRAKAMSRLIAVLRQLPGIKIVNHQDYLLALNQTWEWMSRNIDEFRASTNSLENDLVKWINGYLYWRIRDIYTTSSLPDRQHLSLNEEVFQQGETYLDLLSESGFSDLTLDNLNAHIASLQQQEHREIADRIEAWIQLDPDGQLRSCYPKGRSTCNCQLLGDRLIVKDPPDSLTVLAKELDIPYQTLVAHWKRRCLPILQTQAKIFGYEPNLDDRS